MMQCQCFFFHRKKKSNNTTDDESSSEQPANTNGPLAGNGTPNTRTIKISYGPQGEGTVLKIPAQIGYLI